MWGMAVNLCMHVGGCLLCLGICITLFLPRRGCVCLHPHDVVVCGYPFTESLQACSSGSLKQILTVCKI